MANIIANFTLATQPSASNLALSWFTRWHMAFTPSITRSRSLSLTRRPYV